MAALRTIGLPAQADLVDAGMALFGAPYPSNRTKRMAQETVLGLDERLDALTARADTHAASLATTVYARQEDILPR